MIHSDNLGVKEEPRPGELYDCKDNLDHLVRSCPRSGRVRQRDAAPTAIPAGPSNGGTPEVSLENRLAMGTLKLEGTSLAVTADQAKQVLPLWSTIKDMIANPAITAPDLLAEYQRVEQDMTSDQLQAIQNLALNQTDIQALMQKYNIQVTPFPGENGGAFATLSPDERATRTARETQTSGTPGARFFGTGTPGARFFGTGTPGARSFGGRGMDRLFLDPLILLLQQRAGA